MAFRVKRKFGSLIIPALVLGLALVAWKPLRAQSYTATLDGIVTDASGAVVPNAKVELTNESTNVKQTKKSDDRGYYFFALLPPGSYKLTVESPGFKTLERSGMVLQVQQAAKVNVELSPGEITTKIEVTGEAPRLDIVNATEGRVVENTSILNLPNLSRSPLTLAQLAPGIVPIGGYESGGSVNFSANGGRLNITDVLLDGVTVSTQEHNSGIQGFQFVPTIESVQEFKVQTNSFSPEYGMSGPAVINMVTKSGTNDLHGDLFEFNRNASLTANSFFSNMQGGTVGHYVYNQFGGTVGGPVYIPKVYNGRNKTFFFFHYERIKIPGSTWSEIDTVPTVPQKNGDFSQTVDASGNPITIYDPTTVHQDTSGNWARNPFPENIVPEGMWNPVASTVIPFYPDPTSVGRGPNHLDNFFFQGTSGSTWYETTVKIDHYFTEKQRLSGRYSRDVSNSQQNQNPWGSCPSGYTQNPAWCSAVGSLMLPEGYGYGSSKPQNAVVDYTNTISPTTILNVRAGVSRLFSKSDRVGAQGYFDEKTLGFSGPAMYIQQPPRFWMEDYTNIGQSIWGPSSLNASDTFHFIGSLTKVKGVHSFKAGGEARFQRLNYGQPIYNAASFAFCRQQTNRSPTAFDPSQGISLASFMVGWAGSCNAWPTGQSFNLIPLVAARSYSVYFGDDYRLTPRLTLNLGLRYELNLPVTERHDRLNWIDLSIRSPLQDKGIVVDPAVAAICPACAHPTGGYVYASPSQRSPYDTDKNDFGPRFGFAYQFAPHMVFRGGYGIYYALSSAQLTGEMADGYVAGTAFVTSLDGGVHQLNSIVNPFPNGVLQPAGNSLDAMQSVGTTLYGPMRSLNVTPMIQQWSASIERELPANSVFEIAYSASKGTHLGYGTDRGWANFFDSSYIKLGNKLFDQYPNPYFGLVPATADLSSPTVSLAQLLRPHPQFPYVSGRPGPPRGNSIYHALQFKYTKRLSHGLNLVTHYTFSKLISDSDSPDDPNLDWLAGAIRANGGGRARTQDWGNLRLDRSVSVLDIPHRWITDFSYQLPIGRGRAFGKTWNRVLDAVAGGWQVNGIINLASGPPLIPHLAGASPFFEVGIQQRPNLVSEPYVSGSVEDRLNHYLDLKAFSRPDPTEFGTAPRTLPRMRAPGFRGADMSGFKQFYFTEDRHRYVEIRAEAFNFTNTPVFAAPSTTFGAGDFGVISGQVNSPRILQLGAKFYF